MNRSILIVICDFLLLSLLTFSTLDLNKVADERIHRTVKVDLATNQVDSAKDLTTVMRLALEEERKNRDQLQGELAKTRDAVSEREKQVQTFQQELQSREQQALQLQQQQTNLQQQFAAAEANIQNLNQQLQASSADALMSREKLAAMEAEARKQSEQAAILQQQLAQLGKSNQMVLSEKQQLVNQLQVAEVEKHSAAERAAMMQEEVKAEREQNAKLAEGVKTLASNSGELTREIRENQKSSPPGELHCHAKKNPAIAVCNSSFELIRNSWDPPGCLRLPVKACRPQLQLKPLDLLTTVQGHSL